MAQQTNWWKEIRNQQFLQKIRKQDCIPFVGPAVCKPWIPDSSGIVSMVAEDDYPLPDSDQLPRVSQFLAIKEEDKQVPRDLLCTELKK